MIDKINQLTQDLTFEIFCESSEKMMGAISHIYKELSALEYKDFIKKHCPEDTVEIYNIDSAGTCLCITKAGKMSMLFIKKNEDSKNAYDIADTGNHSSKNSDILKALKEKTAFPFTGTEESYYTVNPEQWKDKMVSMKKHPELGFYYALVEMPDQKVLSFDHYVNEVGKPEIR